MPAITLKTIGLDSQVLESLEVTGAFKAFEYIGNPNPATPKQPYLIYQLVFSNIDGTVSKNASAAAGSATASFWYKPVDLCGGGGNGPTDCLAWGFDLRKDAFESVSFKVERIGKIETTVASGVSIDTTGDGATLVPPSSSGTSGFDVGPGTFEGWFDLDTGATTSGPNNALSLPTGDDDSYLALYLSSIYHPPPPNCEALRAALTSAQEHLAGIQKTGTLVQIQEAEQLVNEAEIAYAPCLHHN